MCTKKPFKLRHLWQIRRLKYSRILALVFGMVAEIVVVSVVIPVWGVTKVVVKVIMLIVSIEISVLGVV